MRMAPVLTLVLAAGSPMAACQRERDPLPPDSTVPAAALASEPIAPRPGNLMRPLDEPWTVLRVGGDPEVRVVGSDGSYRVAGQPGLLIDTPLPVGYPPPTPPGAIELKKYPPIRRAEKSGSMAPDIGMNFAFFPLFNHIKNRDIEMTSPVEMDYLGTSDWDRRGVGRAPDQWIMSFLYREPSNGPTGEDRSVRVVDTDAVTVVSLGLRGRYSWEKARDGIATLQRWLAEHPQWRQAGDARSLYYNGPDRRTRDLWAEVQIPIRSAATVGGGDDSAPPS